MQATLLTALGLSLGLLGGLGFAFRLEASGILTPQGFGWTALGLAFVACLSACTLAWRTAARIKRHQHSLALALDVACGSDRKKVAPRRPDTSPNDVDSAWERLREHLRSTAHQAAYLAGTDLLTHLPNRAQFYRELRQAITDATVAQQYIAVLYLDVDHFRDINDTFGHTAGDTSLEVIARRVLAVLPPQALAGRLASDEIAILLRSASPMGGLRHEIVTLARALLKSVARPFEIHGEAIFTTASIGIAIHPQDGDHAVDLIRNANNALRHAKRAGGNSFEYHDNRTGTTTPRRLRQKTRLREAFERDELTLHYQPKFDVASGRIHGAEALVRWHHPDRGLIYPSDFIPLAEETNLILDIGDWVLNRVCADYREWQRIIPSPCPVAVNLSVRQLMQGSCLDRVRASLTRHGISPTSLELEITETTLMENEARTLKILNALHGMGLKLALDDFGTGYSSLSALQQFPIDTLKIDQSFIRGVATDPNDAAIVTAIIRMAHSLKLRVVAEGVETAAQYEFLRNGHCDIVQGNLLSVPVPAAEFSGMLISEYDPARMIHAGR